jgi:hypothetical protein
MGKKSRQKQQRAPRTSVQQLAGASKAIPTATDLGSRLAQAREIPQAQKLIGSLDDTSMVRSDIRKTLLIFGLIGVCMIVVWQVGLQTSYLQDFGGHLVGFLNL